MDFGSILFILGILILVALFISQPFFNRKHLQVLGEDSKLSALLAEQDRVIDALLELDFDHSLGKIPDETYTPQRRLLLAQGVRVMQQVDSLRAREYRPFGDVSENSARADTAPVSTSLGGSGKRLLTTPDDDLEVLLAARRRERKEKAGGFCPQCGNPVQLSDRFCPRCGETLSIEGDKKK